VRWDVPGLLDQPELCSLVDRTLARLPGTVSVSANPITGRLLLKHSPDLSLDQFHSTLVRLLSDVASGKLRVAQQPACPNAPAPSSLAETAGAAQLLRLFRNHEKQAAIASLLAFADRLFEAAPPAMIGAATDVVTRGSQSFLGRLGVRTLSSQLFTLGGLFAVVWTADALMGFLHRLTSARLAQVIQDDLRNQLYQHLQTLDPGQMESKSVAAWLGFIQSDVGRIGQFVATGIDPIVTMLTNGLIVTATLLAHSPALFAVQLALLPGLYLVSSWLLGPMRERQEAQRQVADRLNSVLYANISGMATIQVFGTEQMEAQRVAALGQQLKEAGLEKALVDSAYVPAIQMVVGIGFIGTLLWGGRLANEGRLSIATYNVMGFSSLRFLVALGSLGVTLQQYQLTMVSLERVERLMSRRSRIVGGSHLLGPARNKEIVFEDVTFEYEPGQPVLRHLNLRFAAGETTGIVGATGAGKTTILKLILRFYDVTSGVIRVDDTSVQDVPTDHLRREIAIVPQQTILFAGTIQKNIAYGRPGASMEEIVKAAEAAQAHEFITALPRGYDTELDEKGGPLSGGQQQRIAIARAILADRSILVFDEATSSIDYETEAAIQSALREVIAGRTTIIVAHRLSTVRHADRIYVLDEGRVCEQGRHEELIERQGIYANLWRIQTGDAAEVVKPKRRRPGKPGTPRA
jgi:ATP-binding cassette subfamily B protein